MKTLARIQLCLKKLGMDVGCYNGKEIWLRIVTERNKDLNLYYNHFGLSWESQSVRFNQTINESKAKFKIVENHITEDTVNSNFKFEFVPKEIEHSID